MAFGFGYSPKGSNVKPPPTPKCPELTVEQTQQLKAVAHMTCTDLVYASRLLRNNKHGVQWTEMESMDPRLQFYTGKLQHNPVSTHDVRFMCCVTTVFAPLDDVIDVLHGSTRGSVLASDIKTNLNSDVLVKSTLKTFKYIDRLKIRLQWMVLKSASPYIPMRDFVYLECQNTIRVGGRAGWASNMHSIALPDFPAFAESHNIIRGSFYRTGYVVTETTTPGELRVIHMMQAGFKGTGMPVQVSDTIMQGRVSNIVYLHEYFRKLELIDRMVAVSDGSGGKLSSNNAKHCAHCCKKFSLLGKKHACRLCGAVVCSACSHTLDFELHVPGFKDIRVCSICNVGDNDLMQSILTEVLMLPGTESKDRPPSMQNPPPLRRVGATPRDSDILGDATSVSPRSGSSFKRRQPPPPTPPMRFSSTIGFRSTSTSIIHEEDEDVEPLPLPRIPHLDGPRQSNGNSASNPRGPSLTKDWLGRDISNSNLPSPSHDVLLAPRGDAPGLDWLDPLDSFRSSVASGLHATLHSQCARSTDDLLRESLETREV
ncbi:hypothetical protein H310_04396 [Aphanomyces invadans]|uniref:FYVE-type domain-containing protein n=1 Tax=Aphanomyces invadans TaxID=157072 RepID=A0A024UC62_9STRA|nr:hypothetical protein H310_04396 [Aphanomyces invadans]ETW03991.1 hypothetical protein H310_04396 [Aphanomyces invadans]|eukprot:XP_008866947.1 hypothetical protein H310_04396 [Aphanomyces invadans]